MYYITTIYYLVLYDYDEMMLNAEDRGLRIIIVHSGASCVVRRTTVSTSTTKSYYS